MIFIPITQFFKYNYIKTKQEFLNEILYEDAKKRNFYFNFKNTNLANIIKFEKGVKSFKQKHKKLIDDQLILKNIRLS